MILKDLAYAIGSFKGLLISAIDYATWFLKLSIGTIIDDCPVSGGRVITRTWQALEAHLRLHVVNLQARVRHLESAATTRDSYMQEEIARVLTCEREQL